jgi:hypothetical protein
MTDSLYESFRRPELNKRKLTTSTQKEQYNMTDHTKQPLQELEDYIDQKKKELEAVMPPNDNNDPFPSSPFSTQVGGSHYKSYAIQPYTFFFKNKIPHHKAAIIRRILRYDHPTGKGLEDLEKIKHEIDLIIDLEDYSS